MQWHHDWPQPCVSRHSDSGADLPGPRSVCQPGEGGGSSWCGSDGYWDSQLHYQGEQFVARFCVLCRCRAVCCTQRIYPPKTGGKNVMNEVEWNAIYCHCTKKIVQQNIVLYDGCYSFQRCDMMWRFSILLVLVCLLASWTFRVM